MYKLPVGYTVFGFSNNGNQMTAQKASSTASKPVILVFDRSEPVWNPSTQSFSVPEFRVRAIVGTVDSDGVPKQERLLFDARFRTPIGSESDIGTWKADILSLLNDTDFFSDGVTKHMFPTCCTEEAEV